MWTQRVPPPLAGTGAQTVIPASAPSSGVRRLWVAAPALLLALAGAATLAFQHHSGQHQAAAVPAGSSPPDGSGNHVAYRTFAGSHHLAMTAGAPWGQPCKPVLLVLDAKVPDDVFTQAERVVREARTAGVDIALQTRRGTWRPSDLFPAGLTNADVAHVPIFADSSPGHLRDDGQPAREDVGWNTTLAPDGRSEYLTYLTVRLHLANLGGDPLAERRALRKFIGWTQGVADTTDAHSALKLHSTIAPDHFTSADLTALKRMSGCETT